MHDIRKRSDRKNKNKDDLNDTVILTRNEYEQLKSLKSTASKYKLLKNLIIWFSFFVFIISLILIIRNKIYYNEINGISLDQYYENDIDRVRKEIDSNIGDDDLKFVKLRNNFRPGRLYHRGGNYGRKK